jgi:hypothetical protein
MCQYRNGVVACLYRHPPDRKRRDENSTARFAFLRQFESPSLSAALPTWRGFHEHLEICCLLSASGPYSCGLIERRRGYSGSTAGETSWQD